MKIHYISDHSILEWDEAQMFADLGHDIFCNGAYMDPRGHFSLPRPGLKNVEYHPEYAEIARNSARTSLPDELIDPFDVIIVMHGPNVIYENWDRIKHKPVIWRTIGQSVPAVETQLRRMRDEGLKIVRYSPKERNILEYLGEDAMIRFYKNEDEFPEWIGDTQNVISFAQSLKGRRQFCHFDEIYPVVGRYNGFIYGPGNDDLGYINGGCVTYEKQIELMQHSRAFVYGGTWPASYTLSFMEAMMAGIPVIAISKKLAHLSSFEHIEFYEVDEILAEIGGLVCDNIDEMYEKTKMVLDDYDLAKDISKKQRELAVSMFGKQVIYKQWEDFLNGI